MLSHVLRDYLNTVLVHSSRDVFELAGLDVCATSVRADWTLVQNALDCMGQDQTQHYGMQYVSRMGFTVRDANLRDPAMNISQAEAKVALDNVLRGAVFVSRCPEKHTLAELRTQIVQSGHACPTLIGRVLEGGDDDGSCVLTCLPGSGVMEPADFSVRALRDMGGKRIAVDFGGPDGLDARIRACDERENELGRVLDDHAKLTLKLSEAEAQEMRKREVAREAGVDVNKRSRQSVGGRAGGAVRGRAKRGRR